MTFMERSWAVISVGCAALLVAAFAQPASASQAIGSDHFGVRSSVTTYPSIPGTDLGFGRPEGNGFKFTSKQVTNRSGGGASLGRVRGLKAHGCNMAEMLATAMRSGSTISCGQPSDNFRFPYIDLSLLPRGASPVSRASPYGRRGDKVDDLDGRPDAIFRGIRQRVKTLHRQSPDAEPRSLVLDAMIEMLANPWASKSTREALIDSLRSRNGFQDTPNVKDPASRWASRVSLAERSHVDSVTISNGSEVREYDLTNSVLEHQLYYDPRSFDILAQQTVLRSTDLVEVGAWLAARGGPAPVSTEIFRTVRKIHSEKYRQRRIPCRDVPNYTGESGSGTTCIDIGEPGRKGGYIITGG